MGLRAQKSQKATTSSPAAFRLAEGHVEAIIAALVREHGHPRHGNLDDPLDELVYIVLSRMTTERRYQRVYSRVRAEGPTWSDVAALGAVRLQELIANLGLARLKAPRLIAIVKQIEADFGHHGLDDLRAWPDERVLEYFSGLPGVGEKTARCVMMYSLGRPVLPVDTHVARVSRRVGLVSPGARDVDLQRRPCARSSALVLWCHLVHSGSTWCRERTWQADEKRSGSPLASTRRTTTA